MTIVPYITFTAAILLAAAFELAYAFLYAKKRHSLEHGEWTLLYWLAIGILGFTSGVLPRHDPVSLDWIRSISWRSFTFVWMSVSLARSVVIGQPRTQIQETADTSPVTMPAGLGGKRICRSRGMRITRKKLSAGELVGCSCRAPAHCEQQQMRLNMAHPNGSLLPLGIPFTTRVA